MKGAHGSRWRRPGEEILTASQRLDLLQGAIADAARQRDAIRAKHPSDPDAAEQGWRGRNPGLARLIDHHEGEESS